ncbi:hypothetical protein [Spirillospora sp. NPDC047279]|uniref:hypothetical protein n=1 Tax=Spirillospora sp. NPDC047279 TaxID=3155478 RepID=UPI0034013943
MRTRAAVISTGVLALVVSGPAAWADDLDLDPGTASPGETVTVSGGCEANNNSRDTYVSVSGAASGGGAVTSGYFSVDAKVKKNEPGRYTVTAKCIPSGYSQTGKVKVVKKKSRGHDSNPSGWATTGGGGAQGPELPWTGAGLAMVAGAAGIGGIVLFRARARGRA